MSDTQYKKLSGDEMLVRGDQYRTLGLGNINWENVGILGFNTRVKSWALFEFRRPITKKKIG